MLELPRRKRQGGLLSLRPVSSGTASETLSGDGGGVPLCGKGDTGLGRWFAVHTDQEESTVLSMTIEQHGLGEH